MKIRFDRRDHKAHTLLPRIEVQQHEETGAITAHITIRQAVLDGDGKTRYTAKPATELRSVPFGALPATAPLRDLMTGEPIPGQTVSRDYLFAALLSMGMQVVKDQLDPEQSDVAADAVQTE